MGSVSPPKRRSSPALPGQGQTAGDRLSKVWRSYTVQKVAMPEFQHEQPPDTVRLVSAPAEVLVQDALYSAGPEVSALQRFRIQQYRQNHFLQFLPHPVFDGQGETFFLAVQ